MARALVVDASVAFKWRVDDEEEVEKARRLLRDYIEGSVEILTPKLLLVEVSNAFWVALKMGRLSREDAWEGFRDTKALRLLFFEDSDFLDRAWELAGEFDRSIYDSLYLALAEWIGCEFYTGDRRLYDALEDRVDYIRWIGKYPV